MSDIKNTHILYVEDDLNLSMVVIDFLKIQGYIVHHFESAEEVIKLWNKIEIDICIIDVMLPEMDGYSLAEYIKMQNKNIPFLFLSAKNQVKDKIKGLELGADDYITKPFSTIELDLRIQAILKRVQSEKQNNLKANAEIDIKLGKIHYSEANLQISTPDGIVKLTKKENLLLRSLIFNINSIVKRDTLLIDIWGDNNYQNSRSMDVYLSKLRKILSIEANLSIVNYHGTGFKLDSSKLQSI